MRNFKIIVSYDGSRYKGWQRLQNESSTIQGKLEACISKMCGATIEITGSGRTDSGVHAIAQVANFRASTEMTPTQIADYFYKYLPDDIVVNSVEEVHERFHARYNAKSKVYRYKICNSAYHDVFERKYSWHVQQPLNIPAMREAARHLLGEHDFGSFTSDKTPDKRSIRTVEMAEISKNGPFIYITVEADGFLYNMVRIIVGTLVEIGLGERDINSLIKALEKRERTTAGQKVPPQGLTLIEVKY
ncbi:MAG: tRNA pseudouridine(38-40) synthase TruA [Fibrobacteres bacterium]|nr:tRNA pseudouridine(38-40) synthase TruA [Fibrobacterota bacterium]